MSEQPTPRTDAAAWVLDDDELGSTRRVVDREFARQLERELAEARAAVTKIHADATSFIEQMTLAGKGAVYKLSHERDQWREVAEELMNSAMDITDGIEWPPFDNAREKFRKLKEASK